MTAMAIHDSGGVEVPSSHDGLLPPTGGVLVKAGTVNGSGMAEEGQDVADNGHWYPRWLNCTNHQFMCGIDA